MIKIGPHVSMSGKEMFLGSVKEAISYGANTFMVYTGAPRNTKRKEISELNIEAGQRCMRENGIEEFIVHAPYIINLANTQNADTFQLAVDFLAMELERSEAMGGKALVLHPGSHVGAGAEEGTKQIIKGLNEVLTRNTKVYLALETMAGKGTEIGRNFEELAAIYEGVFYNEKLRVCFDTCHVHDSGYNIIENFDSVIEQFDKIIGKEQIVVFHLNDSKSERGESKDRHENIGYGKIGFSALHEIFQAPDFVEVPKILETPFLAVKNEKKKTIPPYKEEIEMLKNGVFKDWIV